MVTITFSKISVSLWNQHLKLNTIYWNTRMYTSMLKQCIEHHYTCIIIHM